MDESPYRLPPSYEPVPPPQPWWKRFTGPLVAAMAVLAKWFGSIKLFLLPALKFLPLLLKSGGSMILMIGVYTMVFGWKFAVGFVLLLLVHESGHLIAARWYGLKVGAPMFIPFMGAFIALKEMPRNAWVEAVVGIGGPVAGTAGAVACQFVYEATGSPIWLALAYTSYFLNLFNLMPVGTLDGGRIVNAITPWLLLPGLAILVWFMLEYGANFLLILILIMALPRVWKLFWSRTPEEELYHALPASQRITMAICYFGLAAFLYYQMESVMDQLNDLGQWRH